MIIRILKHPFLAIAFTTLIFILCVMPSENIPTDVNDKLAHFIAFSILFGLAIEIIQGILPEHFHRSYEIYDAFADAIGVILGALIYFLFKKVLGIKKEPKDPFH
jgi:glycopeptide antibiotics resistance protein